MFNCGKRENDSRGLHGLSTASNALSGGELTYPDLEKILSCPSYDLKLKTSSHLFVIQGLIIFTLKTFSFNNDSKPSSSKLKSISCLCCFWIINKLNFNFVLFFYLVIFELSRSKGRFQIVSFGRTASTNQIIADFNPIIVDFCRNRPSCLLCTVNIEIDNFIIS